VTSGGELRRGGLIPKSKKRKKGRTSSSRQLRRAERGGRGRTKYSEKSPKYVEGERGNFTTMVGITGVCRGVLLFSAEGAAGTAPDGKDHLSLMGRGVILSLKGKAGGVIGGKEVGKIKGGEVKKTKERRESEVGTEREKN